MVAAYKMAAVAEPDILGDVEKERFGGLTGCLKERKILRMNWRIGRMRKQRRNEHKWRYLNRENRLQATGFTCVYDIKAQ